MSEPTQIQLAPHVVVRGLESALVAAHARSAQLERELHMLRALHEDYRAESSQVIAEQRRQILELTGDSGPADKSQTSGDSAADTSGG